MDCYFCKPLYGLKAECINPSPSMCRLVGFASFTILTIDYIIECLELAQVNSCYQTKPGRNTAIPYRASTWPEQGFPCVVFSLKEKPVFITGFPGDENRFFPVRKSTQGKPCFHYRDGFAMW